MIRSSVDPRRPPWRRDGVCVIRILLLNQYYWPDTAATAQLLTDLADDLHAHGHEVHIVCSCCTYDGQRSDTPGHTVHNGINVHRVAATGLGRVRFLHRICDYATFWIVAAARCLTLPKMDVCIALTTPPFIGALGVLHKALFRTRLILWMMDVYPDVAVAAGLVPRGSLTHRVMAALSRWINGRADRIISLGRDMTERLVEQGVPEERIATVANWSPGESVIPRKPHESAFRSSYGINGQFVAMYSGNMGVSHEFDTILDAAEGLRDRRDTLFVFVGNGTQQRLIARKVHERRLPNVMFAPLQPLDRLADSLGGADLHLISMKPAMQGLIVPSKVYGILAAGRPAVMIGPDQGEAADTLRKSGAGCVVPPGRPDELIHRITRLRRDRKMAAKMGQRAREYYERHCSRERGCGRLVELITEANGR